MVANAALRPVAQCCPSPNLRLPTKVSGVAKMSWMLGHSNVRPGGSKYEGVWPPGENFTIYGVQEVLTFLFMISWRVTVAFPNDWWGNCKVIGLIWRVKNFLQLYRYAVKMSIGRQCAALVSILVPRPIPTPVWAPH